MNVPPTESSRPRLRLRITATAESIVRAGHPWLFADSVREQNRAGSPGELAVIFDRKDRFLAVGLFDPDSPIRVRVLHAGKSQTIDEAWWRARLDRALELRRGLFDEGTNGFRLINGESDGWPALVLDQYGTTRVMKLYSAVWLSRLPELCGWLGGAGGSERLVLRFSRNLMEAAAAQHNLTDGQLLHGVAPAAPLTFLETGLRFEADVLRGQKTGFFLDQRENRRRVESLARGRTVLNTFSFSGGFSLYAARGGARAVTDLDLSPHALAGAERNFKLNDSGPSIRDCVHETVQADAFAWLAENPGRRFDLVILDPPSFARREAERTGALAAYARLASLGISHLNPGGILLAASCSAHVGAKEFFETVRQAAAQTGREFTELQTTRHAPDHPAAFKEADYLKAIYLRFG